MTIQTIKNIQTSVKALLVFTAMTGFFYPLIVTLFANVLFSRHAAGSLITHGDVVIGSELIAQKFNSPKYVHPRPSAADYATIPSGASNLGPTSEALRVAIAQRRVSEGMDAPDDILTTSGSGLDPHITPESARFQMARIANARSLSPSDVARLEVLIQESIEVPELGFLGRSRINVLKLNLAIDRMFP